MNKNQESNEVLEPLPKKRKMTTNKQLKNFIREPVQKLFTNEVFDIIIEFFKGQTSELFRISGTCLQFYQQVCYFFGQFIVIEPVNRFA